MHTLFSAHPFLWLALTFALLVANRCCYRTFGDLALFAEVQAAALAGPPIQNFVQRMLRWPAILCASLAALLVQKLTPTYSVVTLAAAGCLFAGQLPFAVLAAVLPWLLAFLYVALGLLSILTLRCLAAVGL